MKLSLLQIPTTKQRLFLEWSETKQKKLDNQARERKGNEPGENGSAVALILSCAADFRVRLPIGLNRVLLGALIAFPLLLAVLSAEVLFDTSEITECSCWVVVDARRFWTHVNPLSNFCAGSLLELPWQVVASPVQLKVLVSLKSFVADFTYEPVCGH